MADELKVQVDEEEIPALSLGDMQAIFPTQKALEDAERATRLALPPDVFVGIKSPSSPGVRKEKDKQFDAFLTREREKEIDRAARGPGPLTTSEGRVGVATLAAATVAAPFTGGLSLPARMAVQGAVAGTTSQFSRLLEGESFGEALPDALIDAAVFATAEGIGSGVATGVGKTFGATRELMRAGGRKIRELRGLPAHSPREVMTSTAEPFKKFLEIEGEQVFNTITGLGATPQASQLVEHGLVDTAQKILNKSIASSTRQAGIRRQTERVLTQAIKDTVDELPQMSRESAGQLIQDLVTGRLAQVKGVAQGYYRQADKILGKTREVAREITEEVTRRGVGGSIILDANGKPLVETVIRTVKDIVPVNGVSIIALKQMAQKELKLLESGVRNNPGMERILKNILDKPDTITYSSSQQVRTEFFEMSQQLTLGAGEVVKANKRAATAMTVPLTRAMQKAAKNAGPEAKRLITQADKLWREEVRGELTQSFVKKLVNNQADDVLDAMMVRGTPADIRMIRDIVMKTEGGERAWQSVQGAFLSRMIYANAERRFVGNGIQINSFNGKKILDDFTQIAREDGAVVKALFPGTGSSAKTLGNFKRYIQALESTQRPVSQEATGAVFMQLGQASAVGGLLGGLTLVLSGNAPASALVGVAGIGTAFILAPHMVGRMFANNEIVRWLTIGAKHSPLTVPGVKATIAILGLLVKNQILEDDDAERAIQKIQSLSDLLKERNQ